MSRSPGIRLLATLLLVTMLPLGGARAAPVALQVILPGALTMCSAINRPPMEFYDAAQHPTGVDIALGTALAQQLHLVPRFLNIDFSGLIPALLARNCDIILTQYFITPERLRVVDEIPYMFAQTGILLPLAAPPAAPQPEALTGRTAVAVAGTASAGWLAKANIALGKAGKKPIRIVLVPGNVPALQQLLYHQADAYAVAYETAVYYAHLRPDLFALGGDPYSKTEAGIAVAKDRQALNTTVQTALATLRANGAYAAIFKQWNLGFDMLP